MYLPACFMCKHVRELSGQPACNAFPAGVPRRYLEVPHTTVVAEQVGTETYEPADEDSPKADELVNLGPDSM